MFELTKYYITGPFMGMTIKDISRERALPGTITVGSYGLDVYEVRDCKELPTSVAEAIFGGNNE